MAGLGKNQAHQPTSIVEVPRMAANVTAVKNRPATTGRSGAKRLRDPAANVNRIVQIATGKIPNDTPPDEKKLPALMQEICEPVERRS